MDITVRSYSYVAFGLNILSDFQLPELLKKEHTITDVMITIGDLRAQWKKKSIHNTHTIVERNLVLFQIPSVAIFSIEDGNKIIVSPEQGSDENRIRLYILGSCMGALLLQKRILCLHGSAVAINGKAYAIIGRSGAGKSTLASAFLKQGYSLISDDVIPVTFNKNKQPMVVPAYPQQKLWKESLLEFGMQQKHYQPLFERENKFAVPIHDFVNEPMPLAGVIELSKTKNQSIHLNEITGLDRLQVFLHHTYRRSFISYLGIMDWHFKESVKIINKIQMMKLQRPLEPFTANELVSRVLQSISVKEEAVC